MSDFVRPFQMVVLLTILCLLLPGCHRAVLPEDAAPEIDSADIATAADEAEAEDEPVLSEIVAEDEPVEDVDEDPAEEDPYTGPPPVEPEEVLPEEDFDLVFYFGAAAGGDYTFAIAPEGSEEWVSLDSGWAGTCGNGNLCGKQYDIGKYMLNFDGETSSLWQLLATDPESGEAVNCWHSVPITDAETSLNLLYFSYEDLGDAFYPEPWFNQDLLVLEKMVFCNHCPSAWNVQQSGGRDPESWNALAITGAVTPSYSPPYEVEVQPPREPDALHPDSDFNLVFYWCCPNIGAFRFYLAPEGREELEQPMMDETKYAGCCYNSNLYGYATQGYLLKYQWDFSGKTGDLWQIRAGLLEEFSAPYSGNLAYWHNIPITGTDTYLVPVGLPNDPSPGSQSVLLVSRAQFCEFCPKGWLETNGK